MHLTSNICHLSILVSRPIFTIQQAYNWLHGHMNELQLNVSQAPKLHDQGHFIPTFLVGY